ncbi:MarR family winged helix-turn-helix transcriptional regulator [Aureimonas jatrophae]|uniref:DNA-binding transcriptional regulator, MarR family n=1 Tax=Aureimonas jatrophae TaxID=1166073 RepID=A0A1H0LEJ0_9HYPH|nr:MarR family transcriptional regulator [Aureimonas jatrophae]MBB3952487.1 DNA-binding MarR family transcriptional regulator [Aureimonas jatrophae]SDO66609.1 DNA-binding transcriptional regulator, MarR family [Aureimonas jatrophae]
MPTAPAIALADDSDLLVSLFSIVRALRALHGLKLAEIGLQVGQDDVLLALPQDGTVTVSQLATNASVRSSTISKMLTRLERDGFVVREPHASDARKSTVRILPKGVEIREQALGVRAALDAELARDVDGVAVLALLRSLDRVASQRLSRVRV